MAYGNINVDTVTTSTTGGILGAGNASIMKNRIINGAMVIDQRNAGASVTPTNAQYTLDRWGSNQTTASKYSVQQNAGSVTPPVGFSKYLGVTSLSAYSVVTGDIFALYQYIEGYNISDLGQGTANAKTVTLSFQVYSSLTGTFGGSLAINGTTVRSYPFTYSIPTANTWTSISITVAGDTFTNTVPSTNTTGMSLYIGLGGGSTYSGTAGSWQSVDYRTATGATSVVGTNGATFYITGVQLEVGSSATGYEYRQYQQELALCQRYYAKLTAGTSSYAGFGAGSAFSTSSAQAYIKYPVTMRATPTFNSSTIAFSDGSTNSAVTAVAASFLGLDSGFQQFTVGGATLTQYRPYTLIGNNSTSAYVDFSAEL